MNFNTFINMLRINEAKQMLADKNNDLPLKELYLRLGFNTYSVFNEAFKKHVGVTPAFYLRTIKDLYDSSEPSWLNRLSWNTSCLQNNLYGLVNSYKFVIIIFWYVIQI